MRDLKRSDRNEVRLSDGKTGETYSVYYKDPSTSQMLAYRQSIMRRKGDKVIMDSVNPAVKFGLEVITGWSDGAFGYDGVPISADPQSPHYREDWKDLLKDTAIDVISVVAHIAFDGVRIDKADSGIEFAGEEAEDIVPLSKN